CPFGMNVIFALLLLAVCTRIGHMKTEKLRKRRKTLAAMQNDIRRISERMALHPEPFPGLLSRFTPSLETFWQVFLKVLSEDETVGALFEIAMRDAAKQGNGFELLSEAEWMIFADYGAGLFAPELSAQQENAALAVRRLGEAVDTLETEIKQKGRLFESLGLLSGLALALLVI
ncbi:MAG: hypothetical protein E7330_07955, partial [Clostridiales bacterium]|nr:hypothetical protein [Clostridiales bacterium]